MLLIGSRALNYYIPINRKMHDYDFLATKEELEEWNTKYSEYLVKTTNYSLIYDIKGEIVEIRNPDFLDPTDELLLRNKSNNVHQMYMPFGMCYVTEVAFLYDIKKSTAKCIDEPKHFYDLKLMREKFGFGDDYESQFYKDRLVETQARTQKSNKNMYDFFHKYKNIPEYIKHDVIHEMFADLLGLSAPTYTRLTVGPTEISEELFHKLTHDQKVSLMAEESLVLAMERWFNPRMIEDGINYRIVDMLYNNNEAMPTYKILKHVNITGLKGEAQYIVDFGRNNFFEIEKKWCQYKEVIRSKGGLPAWYMQMIFDLRKRYRNGEKVATV